MTSKTSKNSNTFAKNGKHPPNVRQVALQILVRIDRDDAYLDRLLTHMGVSFKEEDNALMTELCYGVLRHRLLLDYYISKAGERAIAKFDPIVLQALRLGVYQLYYLDRLPDYACVAETVEAVKKNQRRYAAGLVNAILRRCADTSKRPALPALDLSSLESQSLHSACPVWLIEKLQQKLSALKTKTDQTIDLFQNCYAIAQAWQQRASPTLRVWTHRHTREQVLKSLHDLGIEARPTTYSKAGIILKKSGHIGHLPGFLTTFFMQDEAAQRVIMLAAQEQGPTLDVCAAPGGKTMALIDLGHTPITAVELHPQRLQLIADNLKLAKQEQTVTLIQEDATKSGFIKGTYQTVVIDAPCTGSGTFKRHPELKWKLKPQDILRMQAIQIQILDTCAPLVALGGALIYIVCSFFDEEGAAQVQAFLQRHHYFTLEDTIDTFTEMDCMDGFYGVRLRRHA